MLYVQLKYSRTDGRSFETGVADFGESALIEARQMAKELAGSPACDYIEVFVDEREGARTLSSKRSCWSRKRGWYMRNENALVGR